MQRVLFA